MELEKILKAYIKNCKEFNVNGEQKEIVVTKFELFSISHTMPINTENILLAEKIHFEFREIELYLSKEKPKGQNVFCKCIGSCKVELVDNEYVITDSDIYFTKIR